LLTVNSIEIPINSLGKFCIGNDRFCIEYYDSPTFLSNFSTGTTTVINETKGQGVGFYRG